MTPLYTQQEFDNSRSRQLLPLQCENCNTTFTKTKHYIMTQSKIRTIKYCSNKCRGLKQSITKDVFCEQCNHIFKKKTSQIKKSQHNFCSHSCSALWNNTHKTNGTRVSKLEVWISQKLPEIYPSIEFHFNRKDAINSELDIFIPSLRLAFELNGIFHYEPIYGEDKLSSIQTNDNRKFQACLENGIELCTIDSSGLKYFKEKNCQKYLDIISSIINLKLSNN